MNSVSKLWTGNPSSINVIDNFRIINRNTDSILYFLNVLIYKTPKLKQVLYMTNDLISTNLVTKLNNLFYVSKPTIINDLICITIYNKNMLDE